MGAIQSTATATIAASGTTSGAVWVGDRLPAALQMPAAFTGTEISFTGSFDLSTYQQVYLGGAAYSVPVAASKNVVLNPAVFLSYKAIKLVSNGTEAAERTITVLKRRADR